MLSNSLPEWKKLAEHRAQMNTPIRDLVKNDPKRFHDFSFAIPGLTIDYTRNNVTRDTMKLLFDLARAVDVPGWREKMIKGGIVNGSENRSALHTALRGPKGYYAESEGKNVMPEVHDTLARMKKLSDAVHNSEWKGATGKAIKSVVNIGIGGSDLGPRMAVRALRSYHVPGIQVHFVSNVDGADLESVLAVCDPETTLFLVASKTFTTLETMMNANTARQWLTTALGEKATRNHFVALSSNDKAVADFGIERDNTFAFGEWVGGRYSLWSAIGLSVALAVGYDNFAKLLEGGHAMDQHFINAPLEKNGPVILALLGVWNRNFNDYRALSVLPYSHDMALIVQWLQQVDMESNGKTVTRDNERVTYPTGPVIFGTPGTDCQHSFFQLVHQGTDIIPCEFIAAIEANHPHQNHHRALLSNMIAQAESLMNGRSIEESGNDPARFFEGNRPSSLILIDRLDPYNLGQLVALYEHKIFVQSCLWNVNSFDQWGVELGKVIAKQVDSQMSKPGPDAPPILHVLAKQG